MTSILAFIFLTIAFDMMPSTIGTITPNQQDCVNFCNGNSSTLDVNHTQCPCSNQYDGLWSAANGSPNICQATCISNCMDLGTKKKPFLQNLPFCLNNTALICCMTAEQFSGASGYQCAQYDCNANYPPSG